MHAHLHARVHVVLTRWRLVECSLPLGDASCEVIGHIVHAAFELKDLYMEVGGGGVEG